MKLTPDCGAPGGRQRIASALTVVLLAGCSIAVKNEDAAFQESVQHELNALSASPAASFDEHTIQGFHPDPGHSLFKLGNGIRSDIASEFSRLVGSEGVIAMGQHGVMLSIPNADAPSTKAGPYRLGSERHAQRVLEYLLEMGLPADQVGTVHKHTAIESSGSTVDRTLGIEPNRKVLSYVAVIDRQVDGTRIAGSYAWARFNENDEVVAEEIYWPDLPGELLSAARDLKASLPRVALQVVDGTPTQAVLEGEVVIHHSPHFQENFQTFVSVDIAPEGNAGERRLGNDGRPRRFEYEDPGETR